MANELSEISTPRILLFRSEIQSKDTQIKYKPPIVTTRLYRSSYFVVYIFQSLFTFFNICTQIFTLSRSWRDSISFAYSCFISESLLYYHCSRRSIYIYILLVLFWLTLTLLLMSITGFITDFSLCTYELYTPDRLRGFSTPDRFRFFSVADRFRIFSLRRLSLTDGGRLSEMRRVTVPVLYSLCTGI